MIDEREYVHRRVVRLDSLDSLLQNVRSFGAARGWTLSRCQGAQSTALFQAHGGLASCPALSCPAALGTKLPNVERISLSPLVVHSMYVDHNTSCPVFFSELTRFWILGLGYCSALPRSQCHDAVQQNQMWRMYDCDCDCDCDCTVAEHCCCTVYLDALGEVV